METKHSDKAMKTLALMGTKPEDWKQCDIKWIEELRTVEGWVKCPVCEGSRYVLSKPDKYEIVTRPADVSPHDFINSWRRERGLESVPCQNCQQWKRGGKWTCAGWVSTGKVRGLVSTKVWVGYPQWPAGTRFESRFAMSAQNRYCCELCSKTLHSLQIPCVAVRPDGDTAPLGMWVGNDCAKKFLPGAWTHVYLNQKDKNGVKMKDTDFVMERNQTGEAK